LIVRADERVDLILRQGVGHAAAAGTGRVAAATRAGRPARTAGGARAAGTGRPHVVDTDGTAAIDRGDRADQQPDCGEPAHADLRPRSNHAMAAGGAPGRRGRGGGTRVEKGVPELIDVLGMVRPETAAAPRVPEHPRVV